MPNLSKVFADYPEYRAMCEDENGHIWALPWIEQLGYEKTASFITWEAVSCGRWVIRGGHCFS